MLVGLSRGMLLLKRMLISGTRLKGLYFWNVLLVGLVLNFATGLVAYAQITVTSTADNTTASDGDCTLREAINNANDGSDLTGGK